MLWRTKLLIEDQLQFLNIFDESIKSNKNA